MIANCNASKYEKIILQTTNSGSKKEWGEKIKITKDCTCRKGVTLTVSLLFYVLYLIKEEKKRTMATQKTYKPFYYTKHNLPCFCQLAAGQKPATCVFGYIFILFELAF